MNDKMRLKPTIKITISGLFTVYCPVLLQLQHKSLNSIGCRLPYPYTGMHNTISHRKGKHHAPLHDKKYEVDMKTQ